MGIFEKILSGRQKLVAAEQERKAAEETAERKWQAAKLAAEGNHTPWQMPFPATDTTDSSLPRARVNDPYGSAQRQALERLASGLPVDDKSLESTLPARNSTLNPNVTGGERITRGWKQEEFTSQPTSSLTPEMDTYLQAETMKAAEDQAAKDRDPKPIVED